MHTEDDTFNRLRRIPFLQMRQIVVDYNIKNPSINSDDRSKLYRQMEAYGWSLEDYTECNIAYRERKQNEHQ